MNRREFLTAASALATVPALPRIAFADDKTVHVYSGSDSNIINFWKNTIAPSFEKAHTGYKVKVIDAQDSNGLRAIADRALAAMATKADPKADLFEHFDSYLPKGGIEAGLWVNFKDAGLSNYSHINPKAIDNDYVMPYRGSQVLLAYDSTKLKAEDAPKSWKNLEAWIKSNPGQFIYNRPDKGGSGGNFVRRAIHEANGRNPSLFKIDNYTKGFADKTLPGAWKILNDIAPSLYKNGAYTAGNSQSIQLLAQGAVTMTPVWSDQVLQSISQGVLPENTGLVQLQDLALCGGFAQTTVFSNGVNKTAALKLANFMLSEEIQSAVITEIGGFPSVLWDYVSKELHDKYRDVIPQSIPTFPSGDWETAVNDGWYRNVAPNIKQG